MKAKTLIILPLLALLLFVSCEKSEMPDRVDEAIGAKVLFFNLSSDAPEMNLYFNDSRVTTQLSNVANKLRGVPFRSSYPGSITIVPTTTTTPTSLIGAEYFVTKGGVTNIVAKDTAFFKGHTTFFTASFDFNPNKYYSIFAVEPRASMTPVIMEENIVPFITNNKTRMRTVNMISGAIASKIDFWLIHQPASGRPAMPAYKLSADVLYKGATAFADTISAGTYKWMVVKAGAVPTTNTPPTALGTPFNLNFATADIIINKATGNTSLSQRTTYSFLLFGSVGGAGTAAPFGNIFRNRLN